MFFRRVRLKITIYYFFVFSVVFLLTGTADLFCVVPPSQIELSTGQNWLNKRMELYALLSGIYPMDLLEQLTEEQVEKALEYCENVFYMTAPIIQKRNIFL